MPHYGPKEQRQKERLERERETQADLILRLALTKETRPHLLRLLEVYRDGLKHG